MFAEYWWVFILIIFVIMIIYPSKHKHRRKNKHVRFNNKINSDFVLSNLNTITSYYVGIN